MRKQLVPTFFAILIVAIVTVGFSSKAENAQIFEMSFSEKDSLLAAQGLTAIKEGVSIKEKSTTPSLGEETLARELKEGGSTSFRGLSITVTAIKKNTSCITYCLDAEMQLSTDTGTIVSVSHGEEDVFVHEDYRIKVSQIAPKDTPQGVSRRVVLLISRLR